MRNSNLVLRTLNKDDEKAFRDAVREFEVKNPEFSFAFSYQYDTSFENYVNLLDSWSKGEKLPENFVPNTYFVGVVGKKIVGRVSLRHELNDFLATVGGHVGYSVVPSERGKGIAKELLRQTLPIAKDLGLEKILLTCDEDNIASERVILANGGVYENTIKIDGFVKRRFWIPLK